MKNNYYISKINKDLVHYYSLNFLFAIPQKKVDYKPSLMVYSKKHNNKNIAVGAYYKPISLMYNENFF